MWLATLPFPDISPVIFSIGPLQVKWYGLLFVLGFIVGNIVLLRLAKEGRLALTAEGVSDLVVAMMIGIVLGGRIGYVLFYDFDRFMSEPAEIIKIWKGGLSFHGGVIGSIFAILWFCKRRKLSFRSVADACCIAGCPGILFVRCANFINGELWGRTTDVPWAMVFPRAPGILPRHPSQLYEGVLEGLALFLLLWFLRKRPAFQPSGRIAAVFLWGYALVRFLLEFVREPDAHLGTVLGPFSMGQLLSVGLLVGGFVLWFWPKPSAAVDSGDAPAGQQGASSPSA